MQDPSQASCSYEERLGLSSHNLEKVSSSSQGWLQ